MAEAIPIVEMRNIKKSFGGVQALRGVDLVLYHNEVLGLVGDNAAGKSTLMKILSGAYIPVEFYAEPWTEGETLVKLISDYTEKWYLFDGKNISEYKGNTPVIPPSPYVQNEFSFEGAICKQRSNSNQDAVLYVETKHANLSLPEERGRYLAFVRTVNDYSNFAESYSELCVFDRLTGKIFRLPTHNIVALKLGMMKDLFNEY